MASLNRAALVGSPGARFDRLDALRGFAVAWMAVFHFGFDLAHFRLITADFYRDDFWLTQRTLIVSLFLFCAGLGQAVAAHQGQSWPRFWRRWAQVVACAALVSAGSALMFPQSWISFGILHGMAVMLIAARLVAAWTLRGDAWRVVVVLGAGAVAVLLPVVVQHEFFDTRATNWVGLVTRKPRSEDYVPVLPWIGVMFWGIAAAAAMLRSQTSLLTGPIAREFAPLALLGRWSLSFYMLHQPILIGALTGVLWFSSRS